MDQLDLEAYRPKNATTDQAEAALRLPASPAAAVQVAKPTATDLDAIKVGLKLKVAKLAFRGETLNGADCDLVVQGDHLQVASANVADAVGAKIHLSGAVQDFGTAPRFDLAFDVVASDTDRLLRYAHLPGFLNGKIGPSTAQGFRVGHLRAGRAARCRLTLPRHRRAAYRHAGPLPIPSLTTSRNSSCIHVTPMRWFRRRVAGR